MALSFALYITHELEGVRERLRISEGHADFELALGSWDAMGVPKWGAVGAGLVGGSGELGAEIRTKLVLSLVLTVRIGFH
jgi:hypothetical protein